MSFASRINKIKADIQALITYANETTGESDTTISDAVDSLVEGYGGGSGSDTVILDQGFTLDTTQESQTTTETIGTFATSNDIDNVSYDDIYLLTIVLKSKTDDSCTKYIDRCFGLIGLGGGYYLKPIGWLIKANNNGSYDYEQYGQSWVFQVSGSAKLQSITLNRRAYSYAIASGTYNIKIVKLSRKIGD